MRTEFTTRIIHSFTLLIWLLAVTVSASSSTTSSSPTTTSTYVSIRSLDRSGQALQLKHAQAAADQQGRLILAFCVPDEKQVEDDDNKDETTKTTTTTGSAVYILSPLYSHCNSGDDEPSSTSYHHHHHRQPPKAAGSRPSLTHRITAAQDGSPTYMICTGVQADATWLIRQLQLYGKIVQLRYDTGTPGAIAVATAALVRTLFWGYDDNGDDNQEPAAWQSSMQQVWRGEERWGRPIGVRTLVVAPTVATTTTSRRSGSSSSSFSLQIVEPSGVILHRPLFACMGKQSDVIQTKLEQLLVEWCQQHKDDELLLREHDLKGMVRQALAASMVLPPTELQVEVISARGVEQKIWSL